MLLLALLTPPMSTLIQRLWHRRLLFLWTIAFSIRVPLKDMVQEDVETLYEGLGPHLKAYFEVCQ